MLRCRSGGAVQSEEYGPCNVALPHARRRGVACELPSAASKSSQQCKFKWPIWPILLTLAVENFCHNTAGEVRRFAQRAKDAAQARRLLAIAAVLEGASREEAAKIGGMDRQTLRDWVIRFNEQGPDGLINIPCPGMPPKLNATHKAFLARIVELARSLRSMAWCADNLAGHLDKSIRGRNNC